MDPIYTAILDARSKEKAIYYSLLQLPITNSIPASPSDFWLA
jgi:hypothetical protein